MKLNPYLAFNGNCEEAMHFYKTCLNGEFESVNRFKEGPDEMGGQKVPEELKEKIMHMTLRFGDNVLMAFDSFEAVQPGGNITLSVNMNDAKEMDAVFDKLSDGGNIHMPLENTFWGARFGMFTDKFGINWMFNCPLETQ